MISVIIPLMPIEPYDTIYMDAVDALEKQTVECEIIVSKQDVDPFINKGKLLNDGIEKALGDVIWFCDADFIPDATLLEMMEERLYKKRLDVIFPMFYSNVHKQLKLADGAPFMRRSVLDKFGKFNETHLGISWVTFPFLKWCLDNCEFFCSNEFIVDINHTPQRLAGKRHSKTSGELRSIYKETVKTLQGMGVWP